VGGEEMKKPWDANAASRRRRGSAARGLAWNRDGFEGRLSPIVTMMPGINTMGYSNDPAFGS
jgi:hypothetical protein